MKQHLKRIASPKTWTIDRKKRTFITRPRPGAHSFSFGLPLGVVLRDFLGLSSTMAEAKKTINNKDILVDGKRRKDYRYIVGLFDVLSIPEIKKSWRALFDKKGRIIFNEITATESGLKPCKIVGKKTIAGNKIQFNLHDGKNIIADAKANVGDTLLLTLPKLEIKDVLSLEKGVAVFLTNGKHSGDNGKFKEIKNNEAIYVREKQEIETAKNYLFVIGKDKPVIEVKTE